MTPRIAIIGAGVAGCGAARRAAQLHAKEVVVLEKGTPACGSSGRSAGVYNTQTLDPLQIEIRVRSREILFELERKRSLPLARIGNIRIATTEADIPKLETALATIKSFGADDTRILSQKELQALVPDLQCDDVVAGLYGVNDGHLDGHLLCSALIDEARDLGAKVMNNTEVLAYEKRGSTHVLSTTRGEFECDVVINAGGAWAGRVGDILGHAAPIKPEVHEVIIVKLPRKLDYVVPMCNFYMPGQNGAGIYFRQDGEDSLIAGLHTYYSVEGHEVSNPDAYSPPDGDDYFLDVAQLVSDRLRIDDLGFKNGWHGLYPLSLDGEFQIGPYAADPSVIVVAGMGGTGVTSGALTGALAAEWAILGKPVTVPNAAKLVPDRLSLAA
ncbi:sarcosine oxidase, subunit beta (plasmid) [Ensifer sp. WSM1721]|uniref:NAD(P)/FAD-dependent oxidoreductase n=1 Tax=Ensifer sp. WSM1721 TaxID=1041159 RepID=UPI00047DB077|nr:FAD-binding oxidoreductase [Ensifer sp. WSM1721]